jgi:hypothetical protein
MKNKGETGALCYAEVETPYSVAEVSHVSPPSTVPLDARDRQPLAGIDPYVNAK